MEDKEALKLLKRSDEKALEAVIEAYTGYVTAVISNQLKGFSNTETIEELTSDVFFLLWCNRFKISTFHLRGWLGATARNKAKSFLRTLSPEVCQIFDEDCITVSDDSLFNKLELNEQRKIISKALTEINPHESEIIVRYYFYGQKLSKIAEELEANPETVKSRFKRGRAKLKSILEQGGYFA